MIQELYSSEDTRDPHMVHCIGMSWLVLNKYYALSVQTPVYAVALLLDPSKRRRYVERNWQQSWHAPVITTAKNSWLDECKSAVFPECLQLSPDAPPSATRQRNELDELLSYIAVTGPMVDDADDFEAFVNAAPTRISGSPLDWWLHRD